VFPGRVLHCACLPLPSWWTSLYFVLRQRQRVCVRSLGIILKRMTCYIWRPDPDAWCRTCQCHAWHLRFRVGYTTKQLLRQVYWSEAVARSAVFLKPRERRVCFFKRWLEQLLTDCLRARGPSQSRGTLKWILVTTCSCTPHFVHPSKTTLFLLQLLHLFEIIIHKNLLRT